MATKRQQAVARALKLLIPMAPKEDTEAIKALAARPHMRELSVETAIWLGTVTHLRHNHTEYHALLADGYDRDSARHFVVDAMNEMLMQWQARRFVDGNEPDDDEAPRRFTRRRGRRNGGADGADQAG